MFDHVKIKNISVNFYNNSKYGLILNNIVQQIIQKNFKKKFLNFVLIIKKPS